jgi:hypothetical protein
MVYGREIENYSYDIKCEFVQNETLILNSRVIKSTNTMQILASNEAMNIDLVVQASMTRSLQDF